MAENKIQVELELAVGDIKKQIKDVEKQMKDMGGGISGAVSSGLSGVTKKIAGVVLSIGAAALSFQSLKKAIEEASFAEDALHGLNLALAATGNYTEQTSKNLVAFASGLQDITKFSDDATVSVMGMLQTLGRFDEEGLKRATKATLDLSTALRIDLNTAATLVGKAAQGNTSTLSRYGLVVQENTNAAEKYASVLKLIESRFGGVAEKSVNTFSGSVAQLTNKFNDLFEAIGTKIINSPTIIKAVKFIGDIIVMITDKFKTLGGTGDVFEGMAKSIISIGRVLTDYLILPMELAYNVVKTSVLGIASLLTLLLSTVAAGLGNGIGKIVGVFNKELGAAITTFANQDVATPLMDATVAMSEQANLAIANIGNTSVTETARAGLNLLQAKVVETSLVAQNEFRNNIPLAVRDMAAQMNDNFAAIDWALFTAAMQSSTNKIVSNASTIAKAVNGYIVQGFSNAFQAMGGSLVKGENVFVAFGKAVIGALGDMLIFFGQTLIAIGIGLSTVPMLFGLQGPAAIAAGAAALIAGGALKAIAGSGGGENATAAAMGGAGGSPTDTGGGVASGGGSMSSPVSETVQATEAQNKPMTQVVVNVQGNILDRRSSGLEIAEILNETFGTNGVMIASQA